MTLLEEILEEMDRNVSLLEEFRGLTREEFTGNPRHYLLAERCYQIAIQCVVDIGNYLAAQKQWQRPEDARDSILTLGRQSVIPLELSERAAGMAQFRNILVHAYLGINRNLVYDFLDRLDDFRQIHRYVDLYLQR